MTEKEKMLASAPYVPTDAVLQAERLACKLLLKQLNTHIYTSGRENSILLKELLPNASKDLLLEPPFYCDYGYNIYCGKRVFINVNCTF
jgi:maltose O-acetyltransferase